MNYPVKVIALKENEKGTYMQVATKPGLEREIRKFNVNHQGIRGEIRIDDGRRISSQQRKKLYATFKDIADYMGDIPEYVKEWLKFEFCAEAGEEYFSLSNCSVSTAKEFLSYVIEFVIKNGIPLGDLAIDRAEDIDRYLWTCLQYRRCVCCGRQGEIHHEQALGMGIDRRSYDDSKHEKICLCRQHHSEAHQIGILEFRKRYRVYGIIWEGNR